MKTLKIEQVDANYLKLIIRDGALSHTIVIPKHAMQDLVTEDGKFELPVTGSTTIGGS